MTPPPDPAPGGEGDQASPPPAQPASSEAQRQDGILAALLRLYPGEGPVELRFSAGAASVEVKAGSLAQIADIAGFLSAIAGVPNLGTALRDAVDRDTAK